MPAALNSYTREREVPVSNLGIRILMWAYRHLGWRTCRCMVVIITLCAYPFLGRARRFSREFRRQWAAHTGKRPCSTFRHLLTFAYTLADRLACRLGLLGMERVVPRTPEPYRELCERYYRREGVFCIASHLGCDDMLRVLFEDPAQGKGGEIHVFMDTAATKQFARMQSRYASRSDMFVHSVEELGMGMSLLMAQKLEEGAILIIAGDRIRQSGKRSEYRIPFLGREAEFPRGCFSWAAAMACPVYTFCLVEHGGNYDLLVRCLSDEGKKPALELAQSFAGTLEEWVTQYPDNWFNFYSFWP